MLNKARFLVGVANGAVRPGGVAGSAITGEGLAALTETIDRRVGEGMEIAQYDIEPSDGARLAWQLARLEAEWLEASEALEKIGA